MADKKELLLIEIREDGARVVKRNIQDIGSTGTKVTDQMDKLKTILAGLVSAKVLRDTIQLADSYTNMLNRLRVVTSGTWELHAAMDAVLQMSRDTRTALEANVDMYNRIAINTKQMGLEMEDVIKFARQLNHAIILSGVTAREAQWGMVQFSQGLAAGALRGDELRAVMEQLPIVTQTLTRYLGIGRGELRKWAFEGRVTTQVIIDAFNEAEESLAERFGRRIPTVDQALTVLYNSLTAFVGKLDQAIQGTGSLARIILWASDNMDMLGRFVMVAGTLLGGIFLKNLIAIVAQMKLFSLSILTVNPLVTALVLAGAALVVFSDKLRIANDSTATLADFMQELGENAKVTYGILKEGLAGLLDQGGDVHMEAAITFESILMDAAKFTDAFLGLFVGAGQVIINIFQDIPNIGKRAWNGLLSVFEAVIDSVIAGFATLGDMLGIFLNGVKSAVNATGTAIRQMMAGNLEQARAYSEQASFHLKKAAEDGFGSWNEIFARNAKITAEDQAFAGIKFEMESVGETAAEAFWRGFEQSGFISGGLKELFDRAKDISGDVDTREPGAAIFSPTPTQSELLKDMLGDVGKVNNEMVQLKELWEAINSERPGTEGMNVTLDQMNRKMEELKLKAMAVNTDVLSGFERGFIKLGLEITNFADMAEKTITNAFASMEDALVQFVTTGKVDFKSLVDSILADLTRLLARQAIVGMISHLAPGAAGGSGVFSMLANALGGAAASGTAGAAGSASPGRALGGPVSPGMSYMVGERRPEIFQPAQPGHIVPQVAAQQPVQETPVTIINVGSEEAGLAAMGSAEGKRIIRNEIRTYRTGSGQ